MSNQERHSRGATAFRKAFHLLAEPVKGRGGAGIVIQPYRGFGSEKKIFLMGRVFRQPGGSAPFPQGALARDIVDVGRRILRRGLGYAILSIRHGGTRQRVAADRDGYFKVLMRLDHPPPSDRLWHGIELELLWPPTTKARAEGTFFVPPRSARYVVISDIDDTVLHTGVANKALMIWRMFFQRSSSRTAFPGVAAFYRGLHRGGSGREMNPLLYVSRGPWAIYEVLDAFFNHHRIPVGPILFLREWGLTLQRPFPPPSKGHKLDLIRSMLGLYSSLPFILIGDSGQRDPEIYTQVIREHPGRILAIYIRNVGRDPGRIHAVEKLAAQLTNEGGTLVLAADTIAMASHAAARGFMRKEDLHEVMGERRERQEETLVGPTLEIGGPSRRETVDLIESGRIGEALEGEIAGVTPPNVVIGPEKND